MMFAKKSAVLVMALGLLMAQGVRAADDAKAPSCRRGVAAGAGDESRATCPVPNPRVRETAEAPDCNLPSGEQAKKSLFTPSQRGWLTKGCIVGVTAAVAGFVWWRRADVAAGYRGFNNHVPSAPVAAGAVALLGGSALWQGAKAKDYKAGCNDGYHTGHKDGYVHGFNDGGRWTIITLASGVGVKDLCDKLQILTLKEMETEVQKSDFPNYRFE